LQHTLSVFVRLHFTASIDEMLDTQTLLQEEENNKTVSLMGIK
jgi:hypothetical protein